MRSAATRSLRATASTCSRHRPSSPATSPTATSATGSTRPTAPSTAAATTHTPTASRRSASTSAAEAVASLAATGVAHLLRGPAGRGPRPSEGRGSGRELAGDRGVGEACGRRVDRVVERVDGDLLRAPEDRWWRDLQDRKRDLGGTVDRGAVRERGLALRHAGHAEKPAQEAPAG